MPLVTAVLAAALLSGPTGAPADPAPLSAGESMAPGKQIAALAMSHPEEPDFVASKALEILNKGANVGPFFSPENETDAQGPNGPMSDAQGPSGPMADSQNPNGPMADSQNPNGPMGDSQNPNGPMTDSGQAGGPGGGGMMGNVPMMGGGQPAGAPANGDQANGSQPGFMFTMPATGKNNNQGGPQDVFLNPSASQPQYTKLSGDDFTRKPASKEVDDEDAGAWARPFFSGAMSGGVAKASMPKAGKAKASGPKAKAKAPASRDFWSMPGWD